MKILLEMVILPVPMLEFSAMVEDTFFPTGSGRTGGRIPIKILMVLNSLHSKEYDLRYP
jgi:hypothetical protein